MRIWHRLNQALGLGDRFFGPTEADELQLPAHAGIHLQVDGFIG
jgi:hypothetical protein